VKGHEIRAAALKRRNEDDVRFATMTWAQRKQSMEREERYRIVWQVGFAIGGLACGMGCFTDILMLLVFGILGPIALRYDLL